MPDRTSTDSQHIIAELRRERDEARAALDESEAQKAAIAEVLAVINSSPGDLAPVFDAMLDKALRLCEASYGALQTFDGEFFRMVADRSDHDYRELVSEMRPFRPEQGSTVERLVQGETIVHILDLAADREYKDRMPIRKTLVEVGGARTFLSISLRRDEKLVSRI